MLPLNRLLYWSDLSLLVGLIRRLSPYPLLKDFAVGRVRPLVPLLPRVLAMLCPVLLAMPWYERLLEYPPQVYKSPLVEWVLRKSESLFEARLVHRLGHWRL